MGRPQPEGVEHFSKIPWAKKLLTDRATTTFTPSHRQKPDINGNVRSQDQLLRQSLSTPSTIPYCVGLYQNPNLLEEAKRPAPVASGQQRFLINEVTLLFDLQPGVNGYQGTTHGGLMSVILDEALGNLIFMHNSVDSSLRSLGQTIALDVLNLTGKVAVTAGLNVKYLKPLKTPQVVAATATLVKIDGRSIHVEGRIENGEGVVFAKGQSEWKVIPIRGKI